MFDAIKFVRTPQIKVVCHAAQIQVEKLPRSAPAIFGQKLRQRRSGSIKPSAEFAGIVEASKIKPIEELPDVLNIALSEHSACCGRPYDTDRDMVPDSSDYLFWGHGRA